MRAKLALAAVALFAIAAVLAWRLRGGHARVTDPGEQRRSAVTSRQPAGVVAHGRGSIAGTVSDEARRRVAAARVCAREMAAEPVCATADASGAYTIDGLPAARYAVTAFARPYRPALATAPVDLGDAGHVTGISIVLRGAGVELTGVVADVTAGTIAHARVTASPGPPALDTPAVTAEADDQGRFAMWVAPGMQWVTAAADGYADAHGSAVAPGTVELRMTPEAIIEGVVVDAASGTPIAGARVGVSTDEMRDDPEHAVTSDARGAFRLDRLGFGRFTIVARAEHAYGRSAGSLLVGLGQHLDGIVIRMAPAQRVAGRIVIAPGGAPCPASYGALRADANGSWIPLVRSGDSLVADGVPPGTYTPSVSCSGFVDRETYAPITVADRDVTGLAWEVTAGGTLRGKVITRSGVPIGGAAVYNQRTGRLTDKFVHSRDDGSYELAGLAIGTHQVHVRTDKAVVGLYDSYVVVIDGPGAIDHDFVVDDAGTIHGTTVDAGGQPVPDEDVVVVGVGPDDYHTTSAHSNEAGVFTVPGLHPGDYRVTTRVDPHRDDAPTIAVRANQTTAVKILTAPKRSAIIGQVVDAQGRAVSDALVVAVDEARAGSDAVRTTRWFFGEPVLTSPGGTFVLTRLAAGSYAVRAYRRGGGEAIVEHVRAGSSITLKMHETASIAGTVTDRGGPIQQLVVTVNDEMGAPVRSEHFFATLGAYTIADLPKGHYTVQWDAEHGTKSLDVTLGDGQAKRLDVELEPLVAVTGRVVDLRARTAVAGIKVTAHASDGAFAGTATSDAMGRFQIARVRPGPLTFALAGPDPYPAAAATRTIDRTSGTIDIGDLPIVKARATDDDAGDLGFELDESQGTIVRRECKVIDIDPSGPAARTGLREGDVIVRVDGIDLTGDGYANWGAAVAAPPGTKLTFDLARGATVSVVLARPKS